jgi:hypothetical protein
MVVGRVSVHAKRASPSSANNLSMQMIMGGGVGRAPRGGFGGRNPMMPGGMSDALGMGAPPFGDPLGMGTGGMFGMGGGMGLNPYQAADIRLQQRNKMNALRQQMANRHRSIGAAGGTDYSRHVQNINDEMMALQNQAMQQNINNAFKASADALNWARFNREQDEDYWKHLLDLWTAQALYRRLQQGNQSGQQGGGNGGAQPTMQTGTTPGTSWG